MMFVYVACGAANSTARFVLPGTIQVGIALCFGFTITACAFMIGHLSGGHLNPAVTISMMTVKLMEPQRGLLYIGAQLLGAICGGLLLRITVPVDYYKGCFAANTVNPLSTPFQAFVGEFVCTFFLLFVVNAAADTTKGNQVIVPVVIGFAVAGCHMMMTPLTGTSINPSRTLGSAFASIGIADCNQRVWSNIYIFLFAPVLGGILATILYQQLLAADDGEVNSLEANYRKQADQQKVVKPPAAPAYTVSQAL